MLYDMITDLRTNLSTLSFSPQPAVAGLLHGPSLPSFALSPPPSAACRGVSPPQGGDCSSSNFVILLHGHVYSVTVCHCVCHRRDQRSIDKQPRKVEEESHHPLASRGGGLYSLSCQFALGCESSPSYGVAVVCN